MACVRPQRARVLAWALPLALGGCYGTQNAFDVHGSAGGSAGGGGDDGGTTAGTDPGTDTGGETGGTAGVVDLAVEAGADPNALDSSCTRETVIYEAIADSFVVSENTTVPCQTWNANNTVARTCADTNFGDYNLAPVYELSGATGEVGAYIVRFDLGADAGAGRTVEEVSLAPWITTLNQDAPTLQFEVRQLTNYFEEGGDPTMDEPDDSGVRWNCAAGPTNACTTAWAGGNPVATGVATFATFDFFGNFDAPTAVVGDVDVAQQWADDTAPASLIMTVSPSSTPWFYIRTGKDGMFLRTRLFVTYCD